MVRSILGERRSDRIHREKLVRRSGLVDNNYIAKKLGTRKNGMRELPVGSPEIGKDRGNQP